MDWRLRAAIELNRDTAAQRWVFLRHGECVGNRDGVLVAPEDAPLTVLGRQQASGVAVQLVGLGITDVMTSPMLRARQTAALVQEQIHAPRVTVEPGLRERTFGALDGWSRAAVRSSGWSQTRTAWDASPPGGESLSEVARRVVRALRTFDATGPVLVVAHAGVIRSVVGLLDGLPRAQVGCLRVPHCVPWVRDVPPAMWGDLVDP